jgi:hypothetical protein
VRSAAGERPALPAGSRARAASDAGVKEGASRGNHGFTRVIPIPRLRLVSIVAGSSSGVVTRGRGPGDRSSASCRNQSVLLLVKGSRVGAGNRASRKSLRANDHRSSGTRPDRA